MVKPGKSRNFAERSAANTQRRARVTVTLAYGFACDVDLGERALRADLGRDHGGTGTGPDPDQLLRASLATSLLIAYRSWAGRLGVVLEAVALELRVATRAPGADLPEAVRGPWRRMRGIVRVRSSAPEAQLRQVLELAHAHDALLASLSAGIERRFELRVERPGRTGSA